MSRRVKRRVQLFPFQADKAVWWPESRQEAEYYIRLRRCFIDQGLILDFAAWTEDINTKGEVLECCNSWVKLSGIPWNLWSNSLFEQIGRLYGGLLDISDDTIHCRELSAAIIKVRGPEGGFIRREMQSEFNNKVISFRIEVLSVDVSAYDLFERQSYAQVLIKGVRKRAGWGNANVWRGLKEEEEIGRGQNRDSHQLDGGMGLGPNMALPEKTLISPKRNQVVVQQPGGSRLGDENGRGGQDSSSLGGGDKVKKILQQVSPKMASQFKCVQVQSLSHTSSGETKGKRVEDMSQDTYSKFGQTYSRRKKLVAHSGLGGRDVAAKQSPSFQLKQGPEAVGEGDTHMEDHYVFDDIDDLGSEADDISRVSASFCSIPSEGADPLDKDVAVLANLFEVAPAAELQNTEERQSKIKASFTGGEVLSCPELSSCQFFLGHPAVQHSSFSALGFSSGFARGVGEVQAPEMSGKSRGFDGGAKGSSIGFGECRLGKEMVRGDIGQLGASVVVDSLGKNTEGLRGAGTSLEVITGGLLGPL